MLPKHMARIKGFFTEGGKHRPVHARTLFGPSKSAEASARIHIDTPRNAEESISWLNGEWRGAMLRERQVLLVEYANEAANRAGIIAENENVSGAQRREARRVATKYRTWVDSHKGKEMPSHNYPPDSPVRRQHYSSVRPDPVKEAPTSYNPEGGYQGWTNWDTWETKLLLDNDEQLARQVEAAGRNFLRKEQAGAYDRDAARYYVLKYLVPQAKKQDPSIDPGKVDLGEIADVILRDARDAKKSEDRRREHSFTVAKVAQSDQGSEAFPKGEPQVHDLFRGEGEMGRRRARPGLRSTATGYATSEAELTREYNRLTPKQKKALAKLEGRVEVFRTFDDQSARNAEADLRKAGIDYNLTHSTEGNHGQFKMVEFHVAPADRARAGQIIDEAVNL
jgi:hypothetical protein